MMEKNDEEKQLLGILRAVIPRAIKRSFEDVEKLKLSDQMKLSFTLHFPVNVLSFLVSIADESPSILIGFAALREQYNDFFDRLDKKIQDLERDKK